MFEPRHPSTHPPHPPTTEDDRVSWLRLLRSRRVGPATFHRLLAEHGSARAALDALPEVAARAGVENYAPCPPGVAEAELRAGARLGARMLCHGEPGYPAWLTGLPDAPPLLWALGDPAALERPLIAIVGARNASSLGTRMTRALARDLAAEGFTIVSGLARGIDTAAHLASCDSGTIAVMAGGLDVIYPAENTELGRKITGKGLRISEQSFGMEPRARHFPARNRIISGMTQALIVVEAAVKSGSLITARAALDQGREVMAVPGHPLEPRASGCNQLLRDGAVLVRRAEDVLEALGPAPLAEPVAAPGPAPVPASVAARVAAPVASEGPRLPLGLTDTAPPLVASRTAPSPAGKRPADTRSLQETAQLHSAILNRLSPVPLAEDQLLRDLAAPPGRVAPALTDLEMDGKVIRHPGGLVSRAPAS